MSSIAHNSQNRDNFGDLRVHNKKNLCRIGEQSLTISSVSFFTLIMFFFFPSENNHKVFEPQGFDRMSL